MREVRGAVELPKAPGMKVGARARVSGGTFQGQLGLYAGIPRCLPSRADVADCQKRA